MTGAEVRRLLAFLVAAYPRAEISDATVKVYELVLRDLPADDTRRAAAEHVATSRYFPTVAELRENVAAAAIAAPTVGEAWTEVIAKIAEGGRASRPEWSHELIAAAVKSIGWRELCDSTNPSTDRAHFRDHYRTARGAAVRGRNLLALAEGGQIDVARELTAEEAKELPSPEGFVRFVDSPQEFDPAFNRSEADIRGAVRAPKCNHETIAHVDDPDAIQCDDCLRWYLDG